MEATIMQRSLISTVICATMLLSLAACTPEQDILDKDIPESITVENRQAVNDTPETLKDVGEISVSKCVVIDGKSYDLYRTFDDPEKAMENIKVKCASVLELLKEKNLPLRIFYLSDRTWDDYRAAMLGMLDDEERPEWYNESNEEYRALCAFCDFYENIEKNEDIIKYAKKFASAKGNAEKKEAYDAIIANLPFTSLPDANESS